MSLFCPQLLPIRLDWTGQEHPGTYQNLVRLLSIRGGKFLKRESEIKIEFPAIFFLENQVVKK